MKNKTSKYLAHINQKNGKEQTIAEHLQSTADMAAAFAGSFSASKEAYACGMLHDIGKYSDAFQERLHGGIKTDHSTAGAQIAMKELKDPFISFCIAGHHAGIPDVGAPEDTSSEATLHGRLKRVPEDFSAYKKEIQLPESGLPKELAATAYDGQFITRMLYSCLVDADFLDTERFMSDGQVDRMHQTIEPLENMLSQYIENWHNPESRLNTVRGEILQKCIQGAEHKSGLFTLTVPTGGGKTIASMAFALRHANINKMARVIYVIPYCSIIEQTQKILEEIFGRENVIAHYSNVEYDTDNKEEDNRRYLAAENWDSPIVITTAVQFFESLYSNRPSACRKLHNIIGSVIIFDEAQMMPVPCLIPCTKAISELIRNYHCSAVLCTATQPALNRLFERNDMLPGEKATELCPTNLQKENVFQRVTYQLDGTLDDDSLAARLQEEKEVLCIVNSRQQAQDLYKKIEGPETYHLSTWITPRERKRKLEEIRELLKKGKPCRVISTSLIEAGVDVDFPTVYRSFSGLDSIIQAGGRCNREGRRSPAASIVHVFDTDRKVSEILNQNIGAAKRAIERTNSLCSLESIKSYFEFLFYQLKDERGLDIYQAVDECCRFNFKQAAETFHMINSCEYVIYIETDENREEIRQYEKYGPTRDLMRTLGLDAVSVTQWQFSELLKRGDIEKTDINTAILKNNLLYNRETGLSMNDISAETFIT